jgi:hypothetical protein
MSTLLRKLTELDDMNQDNDEILTMLTDVNDETVSAEILRHSCY